MKKLVALFLTGLLVITLAACGNQAGNTEPQLTSGQENTVAPTAAPIAQETPSVTEGLPSEAPGSNEVDTGEGKILIAYFSSAGNIATEEPARGNVGLGITQTIAEVIQKQVGGDLFFIETTNKYPSNYNDTISVAMQELRANARPELATHVDNFDDYEVIFIGYPNWWGTVPQAILTFAEEYDFSEKIVVPFCTYQDSGIGRSVQDLEKALPDSTILESFSVRQAGVNDAEEDIKKWLSELNLEL